VVLIIHSGQNFDQGKTPHPTDTNFEAVGGKTQAGLPVVDFRINSNPVLQTTSGGKIPVFTCFSGDKELSPTFFSSEIIGMI